MFHLTADTPCDRICSRLRPDKPAIRARLSAEFALSPMLRRHFSTPTIFRVRLVRDPYRELSVLADAPHRAFFSDDLCERRHHGKSLFNSSSGDAGMRESRDLVAPDRHGKVSGLPGSFRASSVRCLSTIQDDAVRSHDRMIKIT